MFASLAFSTGSNVKAVKKSIVKTAANGIVHQNLRTFSMNTKSQEPLKPLPSQKPELYSDSNLLSQSDRDLLRQKMKEARAMTERDFPEVKFSDQ